MPHLDSVSDSVDVGIGGGEAHVDLDAACRAEFEPGVAGELRLGPHANRKHHDVGLDALAARQEDVDVVGPILEMLDLVVEVEFDRLVAHVRVDDCGHFLVKRGEDMRRPFHHGGEELRARENSPRPRDRYSRRRSPLPVAADFRRGRS